MGYIYNNNDKKCVMLSQVVVKLVFRFLWETIEISAIPNKRYAP